MFPAASFYQQAATMAAYKFTPALLLPPMHRKSLSGGVRWVQLHEPGSWAKKACSSRSQQPARTCKGHQILTSAEATAFAAQFLDRKVYPTKASQHEFLATCIGVDVEKVGTSKRWHKTIYFIPYRGAHRQFLHYFNMSWRVVESVAKQMQLLPPPTPPPQPYEKSMEAGHRQHTTCFGNQTQV